LSLFFLSLSCLSDKNSKHKHTHTSTHVRRNVAGNICTSIIYYLPYA
jgi:hypothetical protein